jgi:hypothetical protein
MVKKLRLELSGVSRDYTIIGISCHLKDYRITYLINKHLHFNLKKAQDFQSLPVKGASPLNYSFYYFTHQERKVTYYVLANHHPESKLIPSLRQTDYFLIAESELEQKEQQEILKTLATIPNIIASFIVDMSAIKNIDYLLTDLELHMIEIQKKV